VTTTNIEWIKAGVYASARQVQSYDGRTVERGEVFHLLGTSGDERLLEHRLIQRVTDDPRECSVCHRMWIDEAALSRHAVAHEEHVKPADSVGERVVVLARAGIRYNGKAFSNGEVLRLDGSPEDVDLLASDVAHVPPRASASQCLHRACGKSFLHASDLDLHRAFEHPVTRLAW
jgi:hypothetical protein